jgi:hypothetical protein
MIFRGDRPNADAQQSATAQVASDMPGVDEEFVRQVQEFIEQYRQALEALAQ